MFKTLPTKTCKNRLKNKSVKFNYLKTKSKNQKTVKKIFVKLNIDNKFGKFTKIEKTVKTDQISIKKFYTNEKRQIKNQQKK